MITEVNCSNDMKKALNENLYGLLTGKRKIPVVKEVNNTLGKIQAEVKNELIEKALSGDRTKSGWFDRNITSKSITSK